MIESQKLSEIITEYGDITLAEALSVASHDSLFGKSPEVWGCLFLDSEGNYILSATRAESEQAAKEDVNLCPGSRFIKTIKLDE